MRKYLPLLAIPLLAAPARADVLWAPYLQGGTPTAMTVIWRSTAAVPARLRYAQDAPGATMGELSRPAGAWHEFPLTGLQPGTRYRYEAYEGTTRVGTGTFRTNPGPSTTRFRFAVVGDTGSASPHQLAVARELTAWKPEFVIHMGDVVYEKGELANYGPRFFAPYRDLVSSVVLYPTLGNHDYGTPGAAPWHQVFAPPSTNEGWYAFNYGDAQFFALDTNAPFGEGSPQYRWFQAQLVASKAAWKFAFFHHPPFSGGEHRGSPYVKAALGPLFEKHRVQVVFAGHDHHYERMKPRNDFGGAHPVTYLVTGGGGAWVRRARATAATAYVKSVNHFLGVTVDGARLAGEAIDERGATFDTWSAQQ